MDIRIRGTRAEVDALLPGLLHGGLQVRNLYDRNGEVAVYLEPSGMPMPSVPFQEQTRVQSPSPSPPRQPALSKPQAALPAPPGTGSLREHFRSLGFDVPVRR